MKIQNKKRTKITDEKQYKELIKKTGHMDSEEKEESDTTAIKKLTACVNSTFFFLVLIF